MYSVVLMMALTSGGDTPAFGGCRGGCHGCWGGCYGGCHGGRRMHGCCGCYGGGYSCWGGCHGCRGGGFCGRKHGCCGCYGGGYGCYGVGCYGGMGGYGAGFGGMGAPMVVPSTVAPPVAPAAPNKTSLENSAPATLIVNVPANARLSIEGEATTSTAMQRVFVTPALDFGHEYHYTVQAEFQKDGKTVTLSKEVAVKAGEETRVRFEADDSTEIASR
jgi:uncharacterized protein (TIGR03000 family)